MRIVTRIAEQNEFNVSGSKLLAMPLRFDIFADKREQRMNTECSNERN